MLTNEEFSLLINKIKEIRHNKIILRQMYKFRRLWNKVTRYMYNNNSISTSAEVNFSWTHVFWWTPKEWHHISFTPTNNISTLTTASAPAQSGTIITTTTTTTASSKWVVNLSSTPLTKAQETLLARDQILW